MYGRVGKNFACIRYGHCVTGCWNAERNWHKWDKNSQMSSLLALIYGLVGIKYGCFYISTFRELWWNILISKLIIKTHIPFQIHWSKLLYFLLEITCSYSSGSNWQPVYCGLSMWGKIIIPMYRLWLNGLYGLYGPRCPLFSKRPINLISLSLSLDPIDSKSELVQVMA